MGLSAEAVEVLQVGRRLVLAGWCQGQLQDVEAGTVCAYGSLVFSCPGFDPRPIFEALYALEGEAGLTHAPNGETVALAGWNDAPERTLADVVGLFDRVLANVRQPVMAPSETVDHGETVQGTDDPSFGGDEDRPAVGPAGPPVAVGCSGGSQRRAFA